MGIFIEKSFIIRRQIYEPGGQGGGPFVYLFSYNMASRLAAHLLPKILKHRTLSYAHSQFIFFYFYASEIVYVNDSRFVYIREETFNSFLTKPCY